MDQTFGFACWDCGHAMDWDGHSPKEACPACGGNVLTVTYPGLTADRLRRIIEDDTGVEGLWRYFEVLPLQDRANIVSRGEGAVPIERWSFLEEFARSTVGLEVMVWVHRHDSNPGTGSFKDLAGSLVSSAMKERGVGEYVVSSTGNTATAYSCYLAAAGCTLYAFIPRFAPPFKVADIAAFGQHVYQIDGDYPTARAFAGSFATEHGLAMAGGTFDPFRIEAKRTMAFEWYRHCEVFPTVYIQALSGGTGPLGTDRGARELRAYGLIEEVPRLLLCQTSRCAPMASSWRKAREAGFPEGWHETFDTIDDPETEVPTLAEGHPAAYPRLAALVRDSGGEIFDFPEELTPAVGRLIAYETGIRIGSAGAVSLGGFFAALRGGWLREGDSILLTTGEGIQRDPDFLPKMSGAVRHADAPENVSRQDRISLREEIYDPLRTYTRG